MSPTADRAGFRRVTWRRCSGGPRLRRRAGAGRPRRPAFKASADCGIAAFGDRWTAVPELRLGLSQGGREYRLGGNPVDRAARGPAFGIDLEIVWREPAGAAGTAEAASAASAASIAGPRHGIALGFGRLLDGADGRGLDLRLDFSGYREANDNGRPEAAVGLKLAAPLAGRAGAEAVWRSLTLPARRSGAHDRVLCFSR